MTKIIALIVGVVVLVGAAWYVMQGNGGPSSDDSMTGANDGQAMQNEQANGEQGIGTLASLFGMTGTFRCTVSSETDASLSNGVVYVSDGNVRADFKTQSQGGEMNVSMLKLGEDVYTWSDAMPMGVKAKASAMQSGEGASASQGFDPNVSVNYSCEPANVDESTFTPPSSVEFMDMSAGMPGMPNIPMVREQL